MDNSPKEEKETRPATDCRTQAAEEGVAADGFEDLYDGAAETQCDFDDSQPVREDVHALSERVSSMANVLQEQMTAIQSELSRLRTDDLVVVEMHERNRALSEKFYERDVLKPVFLGLIGIADRCLQGRNRAAEAGERQRASGNRAAARALEHVRRAREADRIGVENLLANFSVERFETLGEQFDPAVQRCIERVVIAEGSSRGGIAQRILPGYRRNGRIVRQECVSVCVTGHAGTNNGKGALS